MATIWTYSLLSVFVVSLIAFVGIFTFPIKENKLKNLLLYFVSFSTGALLGDVFIHLLPEATEERGFNLMVSTQVLLGIIVSFIIEKFIHWRHSQNTSHKERPHIVSTMSLIGDSVHNFIDGLVIGASYLLNTPVGIATTIAVILHEIPQEIGNYGVLLHDGYTKNRALFFNFITALTAFLGAILALFVSTRTGDLTRFLIPFTAGNFIYIAGSDMIPELHKEVGIRKNIYQFFALILGVLMMGSLLYVE